MRNLYLARVPVDMDGAKLSLQFDYAAMAAIRSEIGDDDALVRLLRGGDPHLFSRLVAIGLVRNHPEWTAERVFKASPAIRPTVAAVEESLNALYFGPDGPPKEAPGSPGQNPLMRALRRMMPFSWRSARRSAQA